MDIIISNEELLKTNGCESCLKVDGTVLRFNEHGMAVEFVGKEEIVPLRGQVEIL